MTLMPFMSRSPVSFSLDRSGPLRRPRPPPPPSPAS